VSEGRATLAAGEALRLETGAGLIPVAVTGDPALYTMTQAKPQFRPYDVPLDDIARWLSLQPGDVVRCEEVSTGLFWKVAQIASLDAMLRVEPDMMALLKVPHGIAVFCLGAQSPDANVHVRAFAPEAGVFEDPVTGSANGCIAAFIALHGLMPANEGEIAYTAEQGLEMGQPGRVRLHVTGLPNDAIVHVGGHAVTVLRGELLL
jgi:trans-2,3-dihydro-3-hydroxyanthranilate isomerase